MRDIAMFAIVFALVLPAILHPWIGTMLWTWISIMNPHRLTWGAAYNFPFAALVAGTTMFGLMVTRDKRSLPINAVTVTLALFLAWICVASLFAIHPSETGEMFRRVMKIQLMVFVTLALLHERRHVEIFLAVLTFSIGFYGVKGGIFTLATGGAYRVWGPAGSFIEGNNEVALALVMIIPLLQYLQRSRRNPWLRTGIVLAMVLCAFAALGSQSRGAFLAIGAMGVFLWWRSPNKLPYGIAVVAIAMALLAFMPDTWRDRMESIRHYQQDSSAMGRLNAWSMAYNLAKDRPFGGGFDIYSRDVFGRYAPNPTDVHAAHSIYFQVLGEHGFVGLFLFLLFWFLTWRWAAWVYRHARLSEDTRWAGDVAAMVQVSLVGYFVGGAFLSLAYFDLPYDLMIIVVVCRRIVAASLARVEEARPAQQPPYAPSLGARHRTEVETLKSR
jgi:probable O-glycosylation ligase (exosortase A-associated)